MPGGAEGYPDYQRVVNWDGPIFVKERRAQANKFSIVRAAVSRYANIAIRIAQHEAEASETIVCTVKWFTAAVGGVEVGKRVFVRARPSEGPGNPTQFVRLANLGPYVTIEFAPIVEPKEWIADIYVAADNRLTPWETPISEPLLLPETGFAMANGETKRQQVRYYYSGPALLSAFFTVLTGVTARIRALNPETNAMVDIAGFNGKVLNNWETIQVDAPLGWWEVACSNFSGGPAEVFASVCPFTR